MGDRQPCLAECKEQASNVPQERFQNAVAEARCPGSSNKAFVRSCVVAVPPVFVCVRTETMNAWAWGWAELTGLAGRPMQGRCQRVHRYCGSWVEPAADLRRGAHPHVVFRRLLLVLCHSRFASAVLLMKWNPGTNGPRTQGEDTLRGKVQSSGPVWLLAAGPLSTTPCSTRLLPRDPIALPSSLLLVVLVSTVQYYGQMRTEQSPATQRRLLAGSDVPAFWHLPGHNGSLFYSHIGSVTCTYWAHRSKDPFPARLPWVKKKKILVQ